jgi:retron-type reverse transcriptase
VSVSRLAYFDDKLHEERLERTAGGVEQDDLEYEQLGSYFVYRQYRNIHGFFESYPYHQCEKKYDSMVQIDITKCFDSIYTHSLPWAILGKSLTKFQIDKSRKTFGGRFDSLMQKLNHNETNGIVIGPEFSRIFAEIILQSIDKELLARLSVSENLRHKTDYEIFRYVDDYFVFSSSSTTKGAIIETLQDVLKAKKLNINAAKLKHYEKPIITEITVAKDHVSTLLNAEIDPKVDELPGATPTEPQVRHLICAINSNRLIVKYKAAIKWSAVAYGDLLNYTFAIIENKLSTLLRHFVTCDRSKLDHDVLVRALLSIMEFSFFIYSASPKVNHTIRICRLVSMSVDFLHAQRSSYELKHLLFKYIHDNVVQQLSKNSINLFREVESQYLLIALAHIGREYWLPQATLAKHFQISWNSKAKQFERSGFLNHFSITVLLSYIQAKVRYQKLREFIEEHAVAKLGSIKRHCPIEAEALMLLLDLIVCPYVRDETKLALGEVFGLDGADLRSVRQANDYWFTAWGDEFDFGKELDAKRSREVY